MATTSRTVLPDLSELGAELNEGELATVTGAARQDPKGGTKPDGSCT